MASIARDSKGRFTSRPAPRRARIATELGKGAAVAGLFGIGAALGTFALIGRKPVAADAPFAVE